MSGFINVGQVLLTVTKLFAVQLHLCFQGLCYWYIPLLGRTMFHSSRYSCIFYLCSSCVESMNKQINQAIVFSFRKLLHPLSMLLLLLLLDLSNLGTTLVSSMLLRR